MQIYTKFSTNGLFLPKKSYDAPVLDLFPLTYPPLFLQYITKVLLPRIQNSVYTRKAMTHASTKECTTVKSAHPRPISRLRVAMVATQGK